MKRYICLFVAIAVLLASELTPLQAIAAAENSAQDSVETENPSASSGGSEQKEDASETQEGDGETEPTDGGGDVNQDDEPAADTDDEAEDEPTSDTDDEADDEPTADADNEAEDEPTSETDDEAEDEPTADTDDEADDEPTADTDGDADGEPTADTDGDADGEPTTDGDSDADDEPTTDGDSDADDEPTADTDDEADDEPTADTDNGTDEEPTADGEAVRAARDIPDAENDAEEVFTYTFEDDTIAVKAEVSPDSVFSQDDTELGSSEIRLEADTAENDCFSHLTEDFEGEMLTVDLSFCTEDGEAVDQVQGSTELTLTLPETDENAVINNVEVFHYAPGDEEAEGSVEQVEGVTVDDEAHTVSFDAEGLGAYAVRYTVDFYYNGKEYHMVGGATMLLSELFEMLGIDRDAADVEEIDFTDDSLIQFTRHDDHVDWVIQSLAPFDTEETLTLTFADGEQIVIPVTDSQTTYSESDNLAEFMTNWKITVGDVVFSDDTVEEGAVIEYKDGMQYSLELSFAEKPELGFKTLETNPPEMFYQLPDVFVVPLDFAVTLTVNLGRKGVLADNLVTVAEGHLENGAFVAGKDGEGKSHLFLKLRWNWEDTTHWRYFRDSSRANLKLSVSGVFQDKEPNVLSINDKDIAIRREDLHNAIVNKTGSYHPETNVIEYIVTVTSNGTTSDITLTDTLGSALTYRGDIAFIEERSTNTAGTTPRITPKTGNTFNVVIPAMNDGDSLEFHYSAAVDYDGIAVSGNPTFEETGNTAQIFGDSYTPDNMAVYHEMNIEFGDLEKNCINKKKQSISGQIHYVLTWEIETNKRSRYPLAGTTITDTIAEGIQPISRYTGEGVTVKCYTEDGSLAETRTLSWEDLHVDLENDVTWTYHIPDTDPLYRYVLTYDTIVNVDGQEETIVAENTVEGKGGIDSDRAVLPPPGPGGLGITKRATNIGSNHVTWVITLTVSDTAFDYERLVLSEHCGTKNVTKTVQGQSITVPTWSDDRMPFRKISDVTYKETLKKVEVDGLRDDESFTVTYGRNSNNTTVYSSTPGNPVLEEDFKGSTWENGDYFLMEFFHESGVGSDGSGSGSESGGGSENGGSESGGRLGNLRKPSEDEPQSRTIVISLTTEFPVAWASAAQAYTLENAVRESSVFSHINWISVDTPDNTGELKSRAVDTDKFLLVPPHIYKTVSMNPDTTITDTNLSMRARPEYYLLNYPNCVIVSSSVNETGANYPDLTPFPVFKYQVLVSGIQFDEPLVIEDEFDTSLFELILADRIPGGKYVMTQDSRQWSHNYLPKIFGLAEYGSTPSSGAENYNGTAPSSIMYCFGFNNTNWYRILEEDRGSIERTETGFRVTLNELFKRQDGSLYPFYGIEYYLVPKNLEALKTIEQMAADNGRSRNEPKAVFTNTASARGKSASAKIKIGVSNDFLPIDKTSQAWLEMLDKSTVQLDDQTVDGQTVRRIPSNISADDIARYVMKYRVVLNKGREKLNGGNPITAEDEYSSNLSIDFRSIQIETEPEEAKSQISYDFSGNIGYFTIPDETKVVITYEATILQSPDSSQPSSNIGVSNEVRMLRYNKKLDDTVEHGGAGGSAALNPSILVKKYGSGHMESGLNGAEFQLFAYKHDSFTSSELNTVDDWEPILLGKDDEPKKPKIFTTGFLPDYGDGYAEIELSQDIDGTTLHPNTVYGLRETKTPEGYLNPHSANFYCYVFSICDEGETADYARYIYLQDDTMTIRNTPESISVSVKKQLGGNCELGSSDTAALSYQVFRSEIPEGADSDVYMPVMKELDNSPGTLVQDPRFKDITYDKVSGNWEITGVTVGDYLLVEYGSDSILSAHPDWNWRGSYAWSDGTEGSFTKNVYQVYDENGENEQTVRGIPFIVTAEDVRDGDSKSIALTNTYTRETITLTAVKQWAGPSGSTISWPAGKTVTFTLGTLDGENQFQALSEIRPVTLDNKRDGDGEELPGYAVFRNVPKYTAVNGEKTEIRYAVRETESIAGYNVLYPAEGADYAAFNTGTSVKVKNQMESTSISVLKKWDREIIPEGASATFRLYAYTGSDFAAASWVSNVNDITLDGVVDSAPGKFGETAQWKANFTDLPKYDSAGRTLTYLVREIGCTPASYEPIEEYAAAGGMIVNRPAATDFTVQKAWSGTARDAWPDGEEITLTLYRKTRDGEKDDTFSADYVLTANTIVSQDAIVDNYGDTRPTGAWKDAELKVSSLPKYRDDGKPWIYYVKETAVQNADGHDVSEKYEKEYRDKNHYKLSDAFTYSGGSLTNIRATRQITVTKTVTGGTGDITKAFRFTLTLQDGENAYQGTAAYTTGGETGTKTITDGTVAFTLRHGELFTLLDLPGNLSYTVSENEEDALGYVTKYTVNDGDAVTGQSASGTLGGNPIVRFVNRKGNPIPTGVSSNTSVWLWLSLLTGCLPISLRVYRRRDNRPVRKPM